VCIPWTISDLPGAEKLIKIDYITDNHMHIDPLNGLGLEAAKRFERAGGTCMFLVNKMSKDIGVSIKSASDYNEVFESTIQLKERIIKETNLKVYAVIGVHPAEFVFLSKRFGIKKALEISKKATELAINKISERKATALGEMGRPHFDVEEEVLDASTSLLETAMIMAKEIDCALQLHTEASSPRLFDELARMATEIGFSKFRLVKHFSGPLVKIAEKSGIMPSILSSKENIASSLDQGTRFLMESDYIDDNRRPGAVLGPKTVPRMTLKAVEDGFLSVEGALRIHKDNIEKTYGLELS
jgi:TatD-related deoxyribonuclease